MMKRVSTSVLVPALALLLLGVPGSAKIARAGQTTMIKVATLAPRDSTFMRQFLQLDQQLRAFTKDAYGFRLYASGSAGDEADMVRKMRVNQLDAALVTSEGLGLVLPEVNVLGAPGVINTYQQLEAVQTAMLPEFDESFESKGFKLLSWGEGGEFRYFSKAPITKPADIKAMRPWLWPQSPIMQDMWRVIGATPVPLGMMEVFGALQTKMVDLVRSTSVQYVALQWQSTDLSHVTSDTNGVLVGAWLMNKPVFDGLPAEVQAKLLELARADNQATRLRTRAADAAAYKALLKRGMIATPYSEATKQEFAKIDASVRARMTGRIYRAELLQRVQQIAGSH